MARDSFAGRVMAAIKTLENSITGFRAADLIAPLHLKTRNEARKISSSLNDHHHAGRLVKIESGLFRLPLPGEALTGKTTTTATPLIKDRMWSILRWKGTVTVADLQMLTGAKASYAKEFLDAMAMRGVVRKLKQPQNKPLKYQFIKHEMVLPPLDDKKADRLIALRAKKKLAEIEALKQAGRSLDRATERAREALIRAIAVLEKEIDDGK